jgi:malate dehydrogenase (oxaloacetate-decarboxylating)
MFAKIATAIATAGGDLGAVDIIRVLKGKIVRDITVNAMDEKHMKKIVEAIRQIDGVTVLRVEDRTFAAHKHGKIEIRSKIPVKDKNALSQVYTPGVARVCMEIHRKRENAYRYTMKGNSVAIVTDGSRVLGLGDLGPEAAMPVMEGKAVIFKEFADIDAFPFALITRDIEEIIATIKNISPAFGAINLEDISAPRCFEIESRLRREIDIPVFHDDQHGTATVVSAALLNVSRLLKKDMRKFQVVIAGAGAAGTATALMLSSYGVQNIVVCDTAGPIYEGREENMQLHKRNLAEKTNPRKVKGSMRDALRGANVFIGLAGANIIEPDDLKIMSENPVVFALANPDPEISPEEAFPLVRILATGRSDYPNQINNMLAFPGIFRGLLDVGAKAVCEEIYFSAARAIAYTIGEDELVEEYIVPSVFNEEVVPSVSRAVAETAKGIGLATR